MIEGPYRKAPFKPWIRLYGSIQKKIIIEENQYAIIINPYNQDKNRIIFGERQIRLGPLIFPLHPGEIFKDGTIFNKHILTKDEGLIIQSIQNFSENGVERVGGEQWLKKGQKLMRKHT